MERNNINQRATLHVINRAFKSVYNGLIQEKLKCILNCILIEGQSIEYIPQRSELFYSLN